MRFILFNADKLIAKGRRIFLAVMVLATVPGVARGASIILDSPREAMNLGAPASCRPTVEWGTRRPAAAVLADFGASRRAGSPGRGSWNASSVGSTGEARPVEYTAPAWSQKSRGPFHAPSQKYLALPWAKKSNAESGPKILNRYGVPFMEKILPLAAGGSAQVKVGASAERIFLLGMTDTDKLPDRKQLTDPTFRSLSSLIRPATPCRGWADPRDTSVRIFVGDHLGQIRLNYADGTSEVFPLILGEGVWWGRAFDDYHEPFPSNARLRQALASALRLYPPAPVPDGNYIAVIVPKPVPIRSITFENSPEKKGTLLIAGITIETAQTNVIAGAATLTPGTFSGAFEKFVRTRALRPEGQNERETERRLNDLRLALYTSDADFKGRVAQSIPPGYSGPEVSFRGSIFAEILANVFRYNVQDIADKIDAQGMYHTSTKGALSWGGYDGFGFYRTNFGRYYDATFSRDMGRSLQELTVLATRNGRMTVDHDAWTGLLHGAGYISEASRCADYCLRMARLYTTDARLKFKGVVLPPHWGQLINRPGRASFENDGHGLTMLFLYDLWKQVPDRTLFARPGTPVNKTDAKRPARLSALGFSPIKQGSNRLKGNLLRARWPDIKAAGDWIPWQFDHPELSGATNGLLHTTGEAAAGNGYSVFADSICMNALRAFARMADSIGETNSAAQWRQCAGNMQRAITAHYIVNDPKYGHVWTLAHADWPDKSGVLGPLIVQPDYQGFAPEDGIPQWRAVNAATYQRLIDTYKPFGFYGQAMGYGQGFVTEAALLLDRMRDATTMLDWMAKEIYDPKFGFYIVPEGCEINSTGKFWYSIGDLGNGVQEGEIVKTLRLVVGVDDTQPGRLQFFPRLPYDWKTIVVNKYPVVFSPRGVEQTTPRGQMAVTHLRYRLERSGKEMKLTIAAGQDLGPVLMRLGPFAARPEVSDVRVNGQIPSGASVEHSGDSWWVRFTTNVAGVKN